MKTHFFSLSLFMATAVADIKGEDFDLSYNPRPLHKARSFEFDSFKELEIWAAISSYSGTYVKRLPVDGKDVYYTYSSRTFGCYSAEIIFYAKNSDGKIVNFLELPVRREKLSVTYAQGVITVLTQKHDSTPAEVLLHIHPWMIPDSSN